MLLVGLLVFAHIMPWPSGHVSRFDTEPIRWVLVPTAQRLQAPKRLDPQARSETTPEDSK
jgi:hypothetical protein